MRKQNETAKPERSHCNRPGKGALSTTEEIAGALGENPRTVETLRRKGAIPYLSLGHRTVRYKLADVLAALEKRTIKPRNARA